MATLAADGRDPTTASATEKHHPTPNGSGTIGFLLPEAKTSQWLKETSYFERRLAQIDPKARVIVEDAKESEATQISEAYTAITSGAKVLIVVPVDPRRAAPIVTRARHAGVKVIAYDRIIEAAGLDLYDSFDQQAAGRDQAVWLANHVKRGGTIIFINGALADEEARLLYQGSMNVLEPKFKTCYFRDGGEYWTKDWSPAEARREINAALTKNHEHIQGILCASDPLASAVIDILKLVGLAGRVAVTGLGAQPQALQLMILGQLGMTIYKPPYVEANAAALAVTAFLHNQPLPRIFNRKVSTGHGTVRAALLPPVIVTRANIKQTVLADGIVTRKELCAHIPHKYCAHL
jgi:D-xylose transport system substrate-binding protein